jgi:hypothetical protein
MNRRGQIKEEREKITEINFMYVSGYSLLNGTICGHDQPEEVNNNF